MIGRLRYWLEWIALPALRRPVAVVLWGGRPDVDLQAGSREDLERSRRLLIYARVQAREGSRLAALAASLPMSTAAHFAASQTNLARLGVGAAQAAANLNALGDRLAVADAVTRARFRSRASAMSLEAALELERRRLTRTHPHLAAELEKLEAR